MSLRLLGQEDGAALRVTPCSKEIGAGLSANATGRQSNNIRSVAEIDKELEAREPVNVVGRILLEKSIDVLLDELLGIYHDMLEVAKNIDEGLDQAKEETERLTAERQAALSRDAGYKKAFEQFAKDKGYDKAFGPIDPIDQFSPAKGDFRYKDHQPSSEPEMSLRSP